MQALFLFEIESHFPPTLFVQGLLTCSKMCFEGGERHGRTIHKRIGTGLNSS